ncbi:hypothetical protein OTU49_013163 [Cherax quadricarinatus]|uniref:Uncharacterized protein n=1 Tax=Cherax quadricarinatus TaxID=27406 RepID=A0AAW0VU92_CHEQU|nr:UPF0489 protein C5orf22 homolog [Cherax quadricarinatus]XP_053654603.1 UPF0489 protein C5orf22 homolog [Cherax quadricarinatus]XP_053654604.1 UPF0489 protein C5orf22 homolog [Cherax quadricarinatus]XP_053654605.1 UPF0489 protein C5orf22 homolog [Cherax quadricarinatus]
MTETLKKYPNIPVHIVEDHQDVLHHILRAVGSKHLPFTNNLLIHFDSHPDLLIPAELKASEVYDVPVMIQKLSIENWILGATFTGQISSIVWIKPPWSNQIENGNYKFLIGKLKGSDEIRVSCPILYFVGEMLYCKTDNLEDTKEVSLYVRTLEFEYNVKVEQDVLSLIQEHGENYILDIDLDFFTTMNPFVAMHDKVNMYNRLKEIYSFSFTASQESDIIDAQVQKRCEQIRTLKEIFYHLQELEDIELIQEKVCGICETIEDVQKRESVVKLIQDLASEYGPEVDWELVHDAGSTCDDENHELPHHISSDEEIDKLMQSTRKLVTSLPPPVMITMARSSLDDYCPPDQVDMVQECVCNFLKEIYSVDWERHYENE